MKSILLFFLAFAFMIGGSIEVQAAESENFAYSLTIETDQTESTAIEIQASEVYLFYKNGNFPDWSTEALIHNAHEPYQNILSIQLNYLILSSRKSLWTHNTAKYFTGYHYRSHLKT